MDKRPCIAMTALVFGVALSSASAFAQNGPAGGFFGAGSGPQTGGQATAAAPAAQSHTTRSVPGADAQAEAGASG